MPTTYTPEDIKAHLTTSDQWLTRALVAIFKRQTAYEQQAERTQDLNGVGFNGVDAEILSSFAKQVLQGRTLSEKQIALARKKMPKYSRQLARIANKEI